MSSKPNITSFGMENYPDLLNKEKSAKLSKESERFVKLDDEHYIRKKLFHAVQHGYAVVLRNIDRKVLRSRINIVDSRNNYSLLHYAAAQDEKEIVNILLSMKPDINISGHKGIRPIHVASKMGKTELIELFCQQKDLRIDTTDSKGQTALLIACRRGYVSVAEMLLRYGANINKVEADGMSVLHHAVRRNNLLLVKTLLKYNVSVNVSNNIGQTPLMTAAIEGRREIFSFLLEEIARSGMNVIQILDKKDNDGSSSLTLAVQNKNSEIVKECVYNGADLDIRQNDGQTIFHTAAVINYPELFEIMKHYDSCFNEVDFALNTPLHLSVLNNNIDIMIVLINHGANINVCNRKLQTPILLACSHLVNSTTYRDIIKILLDFDADLTIRDSEMNNIFHYLVQAQDVELILYTVNKYEASFCEKIINFQNIQFETPLHYAAKFGNLEICEILFQHGANPMLASDDDSLPIHYATKNGNLLCVKYLLGVCRQSGSYKNEEEISVLAIAAETGNADVYQFLVSQCEDIFSKDEFGRNTLMFAARSGCLEIVQDLLHRGFCVNIADIAKNTALHVAAAKGNIEVVQFLWDHGAFLSENTYGQTPVDVAILNEKWDVVYFFINEKNWRTTLFYKHKIGTSHLDSFVRHNEIITKELLDKCISENTCNKMDPNYEIKYWLGLLDPGPDNSKSLSDRYHILATMTSHKKIRLLAHPVTEKLINLKWKKFGLWAFLLDIGFYLIYVFLITTSILVFPPVLPTDILDINGCRNSTGLKQHAGIGIMINIVIWYLAILRIIIHIMRLVVQRIYFLKDIWNFVSLVTYSLTFLYVRNPAQVPCSDQCTYSPALMFFSWALMLSYWSYVPAMSIEVLMFQKVLISVFKVIFIFTCLFVGQAFAFYIINSDQTPFQNIGYCMVKILGMMIGELELVSYFVGRTTNYLVAGIATIYLFMIIFSIALFNLLVGLAVGDISGIASQASLEAMNLKIGFLFNIEAMLPKIVQRHLYQAEYFERPKSESKKHEKNNESPEIDNAKVEELFKRLERRLSNLEKKMTEV